jgi:hypothetical protein
VKYYTVTLNFEYYDIPNANKNIDLMVDDIMDMMLDQGCTIVEAGILQEVNPAILDTSSDTP